jgi:hypothetical protein
MGGVHNINKSNTLINTLKMIISNIFINVFLVKGHSKDRKARIAKSAAKAKRPTKPSVTTKRVVTKKKQKQLEKALRNVRKRWD